MTNQATKTTITLSKPVELGGVVYSQLDLKEITIGDLIAMDSGKGENEKMALLISSISSVPMPAVKLISIADMQEIAQALGSGELGKLPDTQS